MKKTFFAIAAVVAFAAVASAQEPVGAFGVGIQLPASYIPAAFMANGQPGCATLMLDEDNPVNSTIKVYDNRLQLVGSPIAAPVATISAGATREEYYDETTSQWVQASSDRNSNLLRIPVLTPYVEFGNSGIEALSMFLMSQSLFNSDAEMEYLSPVTTLVADTDYHDNGYYVGGRYVTSRTITDHVVATAFNVVKPGGAVVGTINLPDGYVANALGEEKTLLFAVAVTKFMGNYYLLVPAENRTLGDASEATRVFAYSLTPGGGGSSSLALVADGFPMSVFPTLVNRGSDITVDLGDNSDARQIRVVDQSGRVVKTVPVEAGQRQVKVSTADVNPGVSFINALCGRQQSSYKVVVR